MERDNDIPAPFLQVPMVKNGNSGDKYTYYEPQSQEQAVAWIPVVGTDVFGSSPDVVASWNYCSRKSVGSAQTCTHHQGRCLPLSS